MGNKVSRAVGSCLIPSCRAEHGNPSVVLLGNYEPPPPPPADEGLGHSFCYVRPPTTFSSDSISWEFSFESESGMLEADGAAASAAAIGGTEATAAAVEEGGGCSSSSSRRLGELEQKRSRTTWERRHCAAAGGGERSRSMSETSFKAISGASVSANTATPSSIMSTSLQEQQFNNSSNNILFDRASSFESTSSFSALPLQPVPRGSIPNSGPLSGPLPPPPVPPSGASISGPTNLGALSGSLERGFLSGPLERGFMSGPMERGALSGPLEAAPVELHPVHKQRRRSKVGVLGRFVQTLSGPLQKALSRSMAIMLEKTHHSLFVPMKLFVMGQGKETGLEKDLEHVKHSSSDSPPDMGGYVSSDSNTTKEQANLQWAQGKAGEDRVHVVLSEEHGWLFVGIYDGFNGPDAPDFLMNNLYPEIYRELKGLLWDQDDDEFDFFPGISTEKKGTVFPGAGSDVEGDGIQRLGDNFLPHLHTTSLDHHHQVELCQVSEGNGVMNHVDSIRGQLLQDGDSDMTVCKKMDILYTPCVKPVNTVPEEAAPDLVVNSQSSNHNVMGNGNVFDLGYAKKTEDSSVCQACSWFGSKLDEAAHDLLRKDTNACGGSCHVSTKPTQCRMTVDEMPDYEGIHHEENLGGNGEAKQSLQIEVEIGCRRQERIETFDGNSVEQRVNHEHMNESAATMLEDIGLKPLQQMKMSSRQDVEEKKSVRPKDLLAMQQDLHDHHSQQECKCGCGVCCFCMQLRLEAEEQLTQEKLWLEQEAQNNERSLVDHGAVLEALERALKATEAAYLEMADRVLYDNPELMVMGSCVLVMLMKDEDVYIMNVGDSRAVVAQEVSKKGSLGSLNISVAHTQPNSIPAEAAEKTGTQDTSLFRLDLDKIIEETPRELECLQVKNVVRSLAPLAPASSLLNALQLSSDHSTSILEEVLRIKAEHPNDKNVIFNDRVKGRLKVTRAFGAGFLKQPAWNNALLKMFRCNFEGTDPYITCIPFLHHHRLSPQDQFLVLSSDGLYQYLSNEEVVCHVEWFMQNFPDGDPAQHLIEELLFRAAKKNGMDFHELLDIPQGDRRKYHDDVYVMVISLEGRIWKSSG